MAALLIRYFKICLLAQGPQDIPYSIVLFRGSLIAYFVTGLLGLSTIFRFKQSLPIMVVELALMLAYAGLVLKAFKKTPRFVQMVSAMAGVNAIFQIIEWPLQFLIASARSAGQVAPDITMLLLIAVSWNLAVIAHIFRESFEIRLLSAFMLTVAFAIINITVHQILFKDLGV